MQNVRIIIIYILMVNYNKEYLPDDELSENGNRPGQTESQLLIISWYGIDYLLF